MKRITFLCTFVIVANFSVLDVRAQFSSSKQLARLFRDVIAKANQSTVRVRADGTNAAFGVVVSQDGWILSKLSELRGKSEIVCRFADGTELEAEMYGHDEPFDLVMLKVDAKGLTPIVWADSKTSKIGHWVASVGTDRDPVAVGVLSVAARKVQGAKFVAPSGKPGGYLGVALEPDFAGVKVQDVLDLGKKAGPAKKAGIKVNDQILSINGQVVMNAEDLIGFLSRKKAGETVTLKIKRGDEDLDVPVKLAERPDTKGGISRGEMQNQMGSKLSDRRAGFPVILQHDSILKPADCGGPLVNLDGKVLGINIARAGRTESYAIPSENVRPLLERLKKKE